MNNNDTELITACIHASIALNQGILGTLTDSALKYRMKRIADDLIYAVDAYDTEKAEDEMRGIC